MSDRRVWLPVDAVNRAFEEPAVVTRPSSPGPAGATGAEPAAARMPVAAGDAESDVSRAG